VFTIAGIATLLYYVPYLIKRGWDSGENDVNPKKKKVCDVCFREIKKVHALLKEEERNK
jgi:hypothetical protein